MDAFSRQLADRLPNRCQRYQHTAPAAIGNFRTVGNPIGNHTATAFRHTPTDHAHPGPLANDSSWVTCHPRAPAIMRNYLLRRQRPI